jgi:D-alanyl-D-alanine carboxypeptidase/D-alanyl-D-alanine-endopeptidase (penicillin-binding protein 4)
VRGARRIVLVALLVVVAAAGGFIAVVAQPWQPHPSATKVLVRPGLVPALAPAGAAAPLPTSTGLRRDLAPVLADPGLGPSVAAVVTDPMTGAVLYDRDGALAVPPASTAKLATATAALLVLGPQRRITTRTVLVGPTVYLVGGGDPTLAGPAARPGYPGAASLATLAEGTAGGLKARGVTAVHLAIDTSAYAGPVTAPGWKPVYLSAGDVAPVTALEVDEGRIRPDDEDRVTDPPAAAAAAFAALLHQRGIRVAGPVRTAPAPTTAAHLAEVTSPTVAQLVQRMLTDSDNDLAEALARQVARASGRSPTFAGGAAAVMAAVAPELHGASLRLADGCGLSVLDRASPRALAHLLAAAASPDRPQLRPILAGLPVAGLTGTLADRYAGGPAAAARGVVRAKTGTLDGVSSLAGLAVDRDGRLLAFAVVADRAPYYLTAEAALDRVAARIAGCGCR